MRIGVRKSSVNVVVSAEVLARRNLDRPVAVAASIRECGIAREDGRCVEVLKNEPIVPDFLQIFDSRINRTRKFLLDPSTPIKKMWFAERRLIDDEIRDQRRTDWRCAGSVVVIVETW